MRDREKKQATLLGGDFFVDLFSFRWRCRSHFLKHISLQHTRGTITTSWSCTFVETGAAGAL